MLKAIDLNDEYAKGTIRVSLRKYNTSEDVEKIVRGLDIIVPRLIQRICAKAA